MRCFRITFLIIFFGLGNVLAQSDHKKVFGLKIGGNYTIPTMVDLESMKFNNQIGLDFGAYTNFRFNELMGLKLEALYTSQNIHMDSYGIGDGNGQRIGTAELNEKVKDEFLVFPVLFRIELIRKLDFLIGPQFGFLISDTDRFLVIDDIIQFRNEQIDNFSFSGNIGLSFNATANIDLGLRYNLGLNKINSLRNNGFQFYLGYDLL